jgi:hypothetical protein
MNLNFKFEEAKLQYWILFERKFLGINQEDRLIFLQPTPCRSGNAVGHNRGRGGPAGQINES